MEPSPWMPPHCRPGGPPGARQSSSGRRHIRLVEDARRVLCRCPPPGPSRGEAEGAGRQAGITLGSDKGSHSLVGFLLEWPEEGKREVRRDLWGCPPHPRDSRPPHLPHRARTRVVFFEAVNGRMFTQGVPEQDHVTHPSQCPWSLGPQMDTTQNPPAKE